MMHHGGIMGPRHVCFASRCDPDHRPRGHDTQQNAIDNADIIHRAHFMPTRIDNMGTAVKVGFCPVSVATLAERPAMAVVYREKLRSCQADLDARSLNSLRTAVRMLCFFSGADLREWHLFSSAPFTR